jgi:REP element-mobilizing transposase RayT
MRLSRTQSLSQTGGIVHKFWKCHNSEFLLRSHAIKSLYLRCTILGLTHSSANNKVRLEGFCVMDNHVHQILSYNDQSDSLSNFMRVSHAIFGRRFNSAFKRTGKVANERPKTPPIQNESYAMKAHMYVEANPIRAGLFKYENLRSFRFSSFRYYAFGIRDEFTKHLTPPAWYLALGSSQEQRMRNYRKLFKWYLENTLYPAQYFLGDCIGDVTWVLARKLRRALDCKTRRKLAFNNSS